MLIRPGLLLPHPSFINTIVRLPQITTVLDIIPLHSLFCYSHYNPNTHSFTFIHSFIMKSSMVAALGGLAVLGQASENHTVATLAIVDVKPNTKPIVIPVPTTVVSHDGATVTLGKLATVATVYPQQPSSIRGGGDRHPDSGPPRRPHGSVQPYYPGEDTTKYPPFIIDPMNACARGYSCQPDYEREHHGGVHRVGDDCRGGHCKREDGDCLGECDTESAAAAAEKWFAPSGCRKLCGGGKCWDDCDDRTVLPKPVCPMGYSCQKKRHKD